MERQQLNVPALYFTYREAAAACRLSESMIRKLVRDGKIKVVKFGRAARIPASELSRGQHIGLPGGAR
jgi:excisionase family DNA binding protein